MARPQPPFGAGDAAYEAWARAEVARWTAAVLKPAGPLDLAARGLQGRINRIIPEQVHATLTTVIEGMTRTILTGADLTTAPPLIGASLAQRDRRALEVIDGYRKTAAVEGGVAGAGGFWLALADFPALLVIKIKLLFDLSAVYGCEADAFEERLFILALFRLAFSGAGHRAEVFHALEDWDAREHPQDYEHFDWRRFQQEYRDYIDLAKMAQMIPVVGAPIGAIVNWRLLERLGETAMNGYRMRWLARS
ncbi:MAG: EcsC family protein [Phenylobacterium sp.]|nr:EcsC family protein [Phenylobacterium sp.]